jgi:methyl-accepting chemotaxis protein
MRNLSIGQRLAAGFGIVIALLVMLAGLSWLRINSLNQEVEAMVKERYPKTVAANKVKSDVSESVRGMLMALLSTDPAQVKKELDNAAARNATANEAIAQLEKSTTDAKGQDILKALAPIRDKFGPLQASFVGMINEDKKDEAMIKFMFSIRPLQGKYFEQLDKFVAYQNDLMAEAGANAASTTARTELLIGVLTAIAAVLSLGVAVFATRSITGPLGEAVGIARRVAEGDLTSVIATDRSDETGQMIDALKEMNDSLIRIVADVRTGTESISAASSEIASGNLDLSARTEQQAASLGQTSANVRELTDTVQQNADNARQANQLAAQASAIAAEGGNVVAQVVDTMGSITDSSKKIVDIISVIDGIAFQTNILALNAAVEAARAGEQGRGFAVVASEVRSLAQRSAAAAKEIKTLISDSVDKVDVGSKLVAQAGTTMEEVVASVRRVTDIIGEITAASQEQSAGIAQVNTTIVDMDETTQQNAALVEEAAAAAASMQEQAAQLAKAVAVFKLDEAHQRKTAMVQAKPAPARVALARPAAAKPARPAAAPAAPAAPAAKRQAKAAAAERAAAATDTSDEWEEF